ncbi:hypothetical protein FSP39_007055 [Pinctada imbricata]|uniref:Palmitoyltransferase n=1 Tax=Pinctada imbricata TaxID=66713 RepID=A0AA89C0R2_PINIB|nr:hypothetical protein FSP39_007055 [Pinctada imbricata]
MLNPVATAKHMGLTGPPPPTSQYSENIMVTRLPCIGRIHFVKDKGGMMSLGFVVLYWIYGTWCSLTVILLPHWRDGQTSDFMIFLFCLCSIMCISSLIRVSTLNPGRVPLISEESSFGIDYSHWELCPKCNRKRPPRAHHCRRCQQCVLRMDHHCPWINNCVGEENHWAFMQLLFWAFCLGSMAFLACQLHFWYYPPCVTCNKDTFYIKHSIWFNYLLTVLAVFMMLFQAGGLLGQYFNISMDINGESRTCALRIGNTYLQSFDNKYMPKEEGRYHQ